MGLCKNRGSCKIGIGVFSCVTRCCKDASEVVSCAIELGGIRAVEVVMPCSQPLMGYPQGRVLVHDLPVSVVIDHLDRSRTRNQFYADKWTRFTPNPVAHIFQNRRLM